MEIRDGIWSPDVILNSTAEEITQMWQLRQMKDLQSGEDLTS